MICSFRSTANAGTVFDYAIFVHCEKPDLLHDYANRSRSARIKFGHKMRFTKKKAHAANRAGFSWLCCSKAGLTSFGAFMQPGALRNGIRPSGTRAPPPAP